MAYVRELWRYPVKSMRGERVEATTITESGLEGDRLVRAVSVSGRRISSRQYPGLLGLRGTTAPDAQPLVDGLAWDRDEAAALVRRASADDIVLIEDRTRIRFDVLPVSLVTDGAVDELGVDLRRLRPNIVIAGIDGLEERGWQGLALRVGGAVLGVLQVRGRCVMTTFDPDTLEQDHGVLRRIAEEYDGRFALDCYVVEPGPVSAGDAFGVLGPATFDDRTAERQLGGWSGRRGHPRARQRPAAPARAAPRQAARVRRLGGGRARPYGRRGARAHRFAKRFAALRDEPPLAWQRRRAHPHLLRPPRRHRSPFSGARQLAGVVAGPAQDRVRAGRHLGHERRRGRAAPPHEGRDRRRAGLVARRPAHRLSGTGARGHLRPPRRSRGGRHRPYVAAHSEGERVVTRLVARRKADRVPGRPRPEHPDLGPDARDAHQPAADARRQQLLPRLLSRRAPPGLRPRRADLRRACGRGRPHPIGSGPSRTADDPTWSPDSTQIAFSRNLQIVVMSAAGGGRHYVTRQAWGAHGDPDW